MLELHLREASHDISFKDCHSASFSRKFCTSWKVSVFQVFLVRIFLHWTESGDLICKFPFLVRIRENKEQKNFEHEHFLYSGEEIG